MKRRRLLYSFVLCLMIVCSVACFKSLTVQKVEAAPDPTSSKEAVKHHCDLGGEERFVQTQINCYNNGLYYASAEAIEGAMNDGYLLAYVDTFKAYGMISPDFVPSTATKTTSDVPSKSPETQNTPALTEQDAMTYVTIKETELLDGYHNGKKTGETIAADMEVVVNAYSSNGYYRLDSGSFISKSDVVTEEDYAAAWNVTEEVSATCTEDGYVKKMNSLSGKEMEETVEALGHDYAMVDYLDPTCVDAGYDTYACNRCGDEYTEELEALGHDGGEPVVTVEPKAFSKGIRTTYCTVCGEVVSEETIPQTFPIPLWGVVVIAVLVVGGITTGVVLIVKKRK